MTLPRHLDFVAPARPRAAAWLALALGALALGAAITAQLEWRTLARQADGLRDRLTARAPRVAKPNPAVTAIEAAQWRDAEVAARDLGAEWGPLLQHLAQQTATDLAVTQLEPDPRSGQLQIAGMAATPEAALAFVGRLAEGGVLQQVMLASHETGSATPAPRLPVVFRIHALWRRGEH